MCCEIRKGCPTEPLILVEQQLVYRRHDLLFERFEPCFVRR